ncbi:MAG: RAMP superfamily CRISPR-associated protein [Chloroflexota bacterium]|nr:RAMP superfamily CRISPR-associated protein [Chloroflexota bacterium]
MSSNSLQERHSRNPQRSRYYDLYASYPTERVDDVRRIVGDIRDPHRELEWIPTRVALLATALVEETRDRAKSGHSRYGGGYPSLVHTRRAGENPFTQEAIQPALGQMASMELYPPQVDIEALPSYSFFLQFRIELARPFYSKGDEEFYIHENPLMKDKVFEVPMVRASTWKGALRHALYQEGGRDSPILKRLFGSAREEEYGQRGRLTFYPTFFDSIDLGVINPHSRVTKAGTMPITLEIVPPEATGFFSLLYIPFDLIGRERDQMRREAGEDLMAITSAVKAVMRHFGFSAKRSRGFGLAQDQFPADHVLAGGQLDVAGVALRDREGKKVNTFRSFRTMRALADRLGSGLIKSAKPD